MIGTIQVKVQAARPNLPMPPIFSVKGSPTSVRIMDVPKAIGDWNITNVKLVVQYPDNTTVEKVSVRTGSVWVATIEGCEVAGKVANGCQIVADGIDEDGNPVNGYVLGVGDVFILDDDTDASRLVGKHAVRYLDDVPAVPCVGDMLNHNGFVRLFDGERWLDLSGSDATMTFQVNGEDVGSFALNETSDKTIEIPVPSATSDLENDSGFITMSAVTWENLSDKPSIPSKTSDLENDSGFITASASAITSKRDYTDLSMPPPYNTDYWTRDDNGWFFSKTIEDHWLYDHGVALLEFMNGTWQYSNGFEAATCEGTSSDTVLTFTLDGTTFTLHRSIPNDVLISKGQVQAYVEPFATRIASIGAGLSSAQASITSLASSVAAIDVTKIYNDAQNKTKYVNGNCEVFNWEMIYTPWVFSDGNTREVEVFYQDEPYPETPWVICGSDCNTLPYQDCFYSTKEEAETTLSFTYPIQSGIESVDVHATRTRYLGWKKEGDLALKSYVDSQIGQVLTEAF